MKRGVIHRKNAPSLEKAKKLGSKDFLFLTEVSDLAGVDEGTVSLMLKHFKVKPYILDKKDGGTINAYMTYQVKQMLATRGRIIPGFNEGITSQRQWLEILENATTKPVNEHWYFPPVNPDPIHCLDAETCQNILDRIERCLKMKDTPENLLKLIADTINVESETNLPMLPNRKWGNFGSNSIFSRKNHD